MPSEPSRHAIAAAAQAALREHPDFASLSPEVIPDVATGDMGVLVTINGEQFGQQFKRHEWGEALDHAESVVSLAVESLRKLRGGRHDLR